MKTGVYIIDPTFSAQKNVGMIFLDMAEVKLTREKPNQIGYTGPEGLALSKGKL